MRFPVLAALFMVISLTVPAVHASELLLDAEKIIPLKAGQVPQAPRVAPDGGRLIFEYYQKDRTTLWYASVDGKSLTCLTCDLSMSLENGYWHPTGDFVVFNEVPEGNTKEKGIYAADIKNGKLGRPRLIAQGARPQFSRPNGHVIFFETSENTGDRVNNILAYKIVGNDPLNPAESMRLELRGPIQLVNQNAEISHPSLAPDGTTIVFAARKINVEPDSHGGILLNDVDRQKIYKLWKELIGINRTKINNELKTLQTARNGISITPTLGNQEELTRDDFESIMGDEELLTEKTIVPGQTKRHLFMAWVLGLLDMLDNKFDVKVQERVFPRLWTTDVFGAPVTPLVKDISSTPLPQKWPTVSRDGRFVVFEAGLYTNRHIYLAAKKGDTWTDRAIKITESGTYNSSPEVDPTGEWLYFESNRDGSKGIWRAKLNWAEINKQLGL